MPSVGMKRSTRVCGMKSSDARVLRSGRQVRLDSGEVKPKRRFNDGVEFNNSVKKNPKSEVPKSRADVNKKPKRPGHEENPKKRSGKVKGAAKNNGGTVDKMFGIVYSRKRKRNAVPKCHLSENSELKTPIGSTVLETDKLVSKVASHPMFRASKLTLRSSIQKRRSSLRKMRARDPISSGALMSDLISSRRNGIPFSSVVSKNKLRRNSDLSDVRSSISDLKPKLELESDSLQCSANVLIIEPDRCYREEGAIVTLELSASKEWLLVVKKDKKTKYTQKADKSMRPPSVSRFTRAMIWTGDDTWKLEFPNRQDWILFKDLYKECNERNVPASTCIVIPVPGVCEVSGYDYEGKPSVPFRRPDSYILFDGDELSRTLAKRTANYDMDSEDEEWLKKLNNEFGHCEHLSEDCFVLMVDAFEKACFCSPDDHSNVIAAAADLGISGVVEAVHAYWLRKRDQRRSPLLRVFQVHQVQKAPVVPQPFLRKRRSFKRQANQAREKQPSLLQAMIAAYDASVEEDVMVKVEEARAAAMSSIESAIVRRQHAQLLMQNADMATYKAMMALRIAEAASLTELSEDSVAHFLIDEVPVVS
ncbi:Enhancer of polycomb-like transcription factor protein, putative isoform 2 [Hibiscus syriacus]|uniref:Enhancer of polycomb-like protein n=1 Tax=Hibiscus syriacus TaxID=106335 RepID=A0A6A2YDQ0_HIBSY|nr:uncharacterized protein LOC120172809 [Hibiscus syriacus]KAE8671857.1 Enhancer of polycomb-like transcription factor protein, putative isoform 2 [Hibiscus syriacus]